MPKNLRGRHFLTLLDFTPEEIQYLLDLASDLKRAKRLGYEAKQLTGKNIALIFEKASTRTRCSFEVAAYDQGAHVTYLGPTGSQIGKKESIADTARVLGRFYDGIEYRGYGQDKVDALADHSGVVVWNGLTTEYHPTQILADFLTILEHKGRLKGIKFVYAGDGRNDMANSLMIGAVKMGMDFRICAPVDLYPDEALVEQCREIAKTTGAIITLSDDLELAVKDADVVYTDVWVSMGEAKAVWKERIEKLKPFQVNQAMMDLADEEAIFMHCLPAFHDLNTEVGQEIFKDFELDAMEVTDDVFESKQSVVFDEAENRLHTIKAVMVATLG